jgi:hypothetical protein
MNADERDRMLLERVATLTPTILTSIAITITIMATNAIILNDNRSSNEDHKTTPCTGRNQDLWHLPLYSHPTTED